jgi:hypothetical protein
VDIKEMGRDEKPSHTEAGGHGFDVLGNGGDFVAVKTPIVAWVSVYVSTPCNPHYWCH